MNECSEFDRNNQGRRNASNFGGQSLKKHLNGFYLFLMRQNVGVPIG